MWFSAANASRGKASATTASSLNFHILRKRHVPSAYTETKLGFGLSVEQIAKALGLDVEIVRQVAQASGADSSES